ncbi:MAG: exo-alpha-sialidase [Verrucomicrobia bacterium]|nr:exo-alpha-sialidase [Verrucomicrobiota bacterium]
MKLLWNLLWLIFFSTSTCFGALKAKPHAPVHTTRLSPLPDDLSCLRVNDPAELRGYEYFKNVTFDPQLAINPHNPKNMVMVLQQDVLTNAIYNGSATLGVAALYTFDGGHTWDYSDLVLSRCQGATAFKGNDNFISAYFPSVTFDKEGNCYILSSSYNLFNANAKTLPNMCEGNIVAKSTNGGITWNRAQSAFRDDGTCHFLDFPQIQGDPYRSSTLYIVSSDHTCLVQDQCQDENANGNQNVFFQKSTDGGNHWSAPLIIDSFVPIDFDICIPRPILNQLFVLPDRHNTLLVSTVLQKHVPDDISPTLPDSILVWRSKDQGETWKGYTITENIRHQMAVDPDSADPVLPVTGLLMKDMAVNPSNGYVYVVYADPQFNPTGQAGCVIRVSKDGGKTWSRPKPVNPKTTNIQTFLPSVAIAKDGTVGVLFYDFRHFTPGEESLKTDVWLSLFDKNLDKHQGEVRLTKESFNSRLAIRGYNGVDATTCHFDYYLSSNIGLEANGNHFEACFVVTNDGCPEAQIASFPCDSFSLSVDTCNRQDVVYVHIHRD